MKIQRLFIQIFIVVMILILIEFESFASSKEIGMKNCSNNEFYIDEAELIIESWMLTDEHWELNNGETYLIYESKIGEEKGLSFNNNAFLKSILRVDFEEDLHFEPWMFN